MKSLLTILLIVLTLSSCCTTKKAINTQPEPTKEVSVVTEVPDVAETPETPKLPDVKIPEPPKPPTLEEVEVIDDYKPEAFNHYRWNQLLEKNVSISGNVDYNAFKSDRTELQVYIDNLTENLPTEDWNKQDKLAYWINAYNALTVDLILRNYPLESIKAIKDPWDFKWFKKDFEQNGTLIDFLNQYSDIIISESAKKSFKDYNWNLND